MIYNSTRNRDLTADSATAVKNGIAPDGGLYMMNDWSSIPFDYRTVIGLDAKSISTAVLSALLDDFSPEQIRAMVDKAYTGRFDVPELTPTRRVGDRYICELWHGPTAAFKDVALSVLPHLLTGAKQNLKDADETLILTATSGDTGKAALAGFAGVPGVKILVFYPKDGVSAVQKAQMVTQEGENVCVCAVQGNFDDAQTGVKKTFAAFAEKGVPGLRLSSANSINIGRLAPQLMYYFKAYGDLVKAGAVSLGEPVNFSVPTGNFGDILAGYLAKCLGLPVGKLICASNANNVLTDFISTGVYDRRRTFYKTLSPSMDILVSSNLERLLYLLSDGDAAQVAGYMEQLNKQGYYRVSDALLKKIQETFIAGYCDDETTRQTISRVWKTDGYVCDPHTAVGVAVADALSVQGVTVVLSTASPYKFPVAVLTALGEQAGEDEFADMERLSELTGTKIPENLAGLKNKRPLHTDTVSVRELTDYVYRKAGEKQWNK